MNVIVSIRDEGNERALNSPVFPLKACTVKRPIQAGDHDTVPCAAGMDKLVVANVDTDVVDIASAPAGCIKEDQISRTQMAATDVATVISLFS